MRRSLFFVLSTIWVLVPSVFGAEPNSIDELIAPGAKLTLVSDGYKFTEGPARDSDGNVYFTDQPNDRILRWDANSKEVTSWMQPAGRSNGLYFASPETLIACADDKNELWAIDVASKSHTVLASGFKNRLLNGPNDCWVDADGTIYFTDPFYKRPYWSRGEKELDTQDVYRVPAGGGEPVVAATDFAQPNGIIGDRQKRLLFVADIRGQKTYRFRIDESGQLVDRKLHCESGSDGMTLDEAGRLYLTGKKGVTVFSPDGKEIGVIEVPKSWTANVCFGGVENRTLCVTASDSFYTLELAARGAN